MKIAKTIIRILLGAIYFVFGLNFFFRVIPVPEPVAPAAAFEQAIFATGYLFPLVKIIEVVGGLMLLTNRFLPLGLVLLAPITLNILALHIFLDPAGMPMAVMLAAMHLFLGFSHREAFRPLLVARAISES